MIEQWESSCNAATLVSARKSNKGGRGWARRGPTAGGHTRRLAGCCFTSSTNCPAAALLRMEERSVKKARNLKMKPQGLGLLRFSHNYFSFPYFLFRLGLLFFFFQTTFTIGVSKPPDLGRQISSTALEISTLLSALLTFAGISAVSLRRRANNSTSFAQLKWLRSWGPL